MNASGALQFHGEDVTELDLFQKEELEFRAAVVVDRPALAESRDGREQGRRVVRSPAYVKRSLASGRPLAPRRCYRPPAGKPGPPAE